MIPCPKINRWWLDAPPKLLTLVILVCLITYYLGFTVGIDNKDLTKHVIPWLSVIQNNGFRALSGEFSDYTPPYLYLLWIFSLGDGLLTDTTQIKLINLLFIGVTSRFIFL